MASDTTTQQRNEYVVTLHLMWCKGGDREITVPVTYRKSEIHTSESRRYDVLVDDVYVGWVLNYGDGWSAYIKASEDVTKIHDDFKGRCVAHRWGSRHGAVGELVWELGKNAHCGALSSRAAEVYPEIDWSK